MTIAETAQKLIQSYGRDITIHKTSETPADGMKPWRGPTALVGGGGSASVTLKAVFEERSESELARSLASLTGSGRDTPRRARSRFLVAALDLGDFLPEQGDFISDEDMRWRITSIETVQPGSEKIVHMFEVSL